jgi:FAD/FMN-containing dehydrogenase
MQQRGFLGPVAVALVESAASGAALRWIRLFLSTPNTLDQRTVLLGSLGAKCSLTSVDVSATDVLQEYSIPEPGFLAFARGMATLLRRRGVEALNVSIRHSPADRVSALAWAQQEVSSFVLYHKQRTWRSVQERIATWTRELIDLALEQGGRYDLPYQRHASTVQFARVYPEADRLRSLKRAVDPDGKFFNELWRQYL